MLQDVLAGLVERVTLQDAVKGFCVLRASARGYSGPVTVVLYSAVIFARERITATCR